MASVNKVMIGKMRTRVPSATLYAWRERSAQFADGRVNAKVAVADDEVCFITSANLTGHATERNMEAGVLLSGGQIPQLLHDHLQALIDTQTVTCVWPGSRSTLAVPLRACDSIPCLPNSLSTEGLISCP